MTIGIDTAFIKQYEANVMHYLSQKGSYLMPHVTKVSQNSETKFWDWIGATEAVEKVGRHVDTPLMDVPHSRRAVSTRDFMWAALIDDEDLLRTMNDFTSPYVKEAAEAMGRKVDDIIIESFFGKARTGKEGNTLVSFPSEHTIAHNSEGLTLAKLTEVRKKFKQWHVPQGTKICLGITAEDWEDLLNINELYNADTSNKKALVDGEVMYFMGIYFVSCERFKTVGGTRQLPAWAQDGIYLSQARGVETRIEERSDKSYAKQVFMRMSYGATRMEERRVLQVQCQ